MIRLCFSAASSKLKAKVNTEKIPTVSKKISPRTSIDDHNDIRRKNKSRRRYAQAHLNGLRKTRHDDTQIKKKKENRNSASDYVLKNS